MMKKLSDFEGEKGIQVAADLLDIIMGMIAKEPNKNAPKDQTYAGMFAAFMRACPSEMNSIFAILSEENPETYHCNGAEALSNALVMANDSVIIQLFTLQGRRKGATSSGSAPESTGEN